MSVRIINLPILHRLNRKAKTGDRGHHPVLSTPLNTTLAVGNGKLHSQIFQNCSQIVAKIKYQPNKCSFWFGRSEWENCAMCINFDGGQKFTKTRLATTVFPPVLSTYLSAFLCSVLFFPIPFPLPFVVPNDARLFCNKWFRKALFFCLVSHCLDSKVTELLCCSSTNGSLRIGN